MNKEIEVFNIHGYDINIIKEEEHFKFNYKDLELMRVRQPLYNVSYNESSKTLISICKSELSRNLLSSDSFKRYIRDKKLEKLEIRDERTTR